MFRIADKQGRDVDFKLNRDQASLDTNLTGRDRVPKARQLGISSYVLGRFTAACLYKRNTRAVVISHDKESTQRMLGKVHYMLDNIKGPAPTTKLANRNELSFPKTNSYFYIGTAGARKFGRGDTITHLHCSEIAFWPDPKSLVSGLYQAVPRTGEIFEESTGNGVGNYYHRQCMHSYEGLGRFKLHFFTWIGFHEYFVPLSADSKRHLADTLKEEWEEPYLHEELNVSLEQIAWRREKLEELDFDLRLFKQEYPVTLDECFQSTGYSLFPNVNFVQEQDWTQMDQNLWVVKKDYDQAQTNKEQRYAIGVDVSAGVSRDRSVAIVIDLVKNKQVAEWVADNVPPDLLAYKIKMLGEMWNEAFITVESNNHGGMTLLKLKEIYTPGLLYQHKQDTDTIIEYGYQTTAKTKPLLINNLRAEFTEGFTICSPALKNELATFIETGQGKLEAESGCHDDRVMAAAVGCMGARKSFVKMNVQQRQEQQQRSAVNPFGLDALLEEFDRKREGEFPIPPQHRGTYH